MRTARPLLRQFLSPRLVTPMRYIIMAAVAATYSLHDEMLPEIINIEKLTPEQREFLNNPCSKITDREIKYMQEVEKLDQKTIRAIVANFIELSYENSKDDGYGMAPMCREDLLKLAKSKVLHKKATETKSSPELR